MAERPSIQQVTQFLQSIGFNQIQAAGIAGNLAVETGNFDPNVIAGRRRGDNGTAFGMMQWRHGRQTNFFNFAKEINKDPYDWRTQLLFVKAEMIPSSKYTDAGSVLAAQELSKARNVYDATRAFIHAERPAGYTRANPEQGMHFRERFAAAQRAGGGNPQQDTGSQNEQVSWDQQTAQLEGVGQFTLGERETAVGKTDDLTELGLYSPDDEHPYSYSNFADSVLPRGTDPSRFMGTSPLSFSDFDQQSPFNLAGNFSGANNLYGNTLPSQTRRAFGI